MAEVSVSILNLIGNEDVTHVFYDLEVAKTDYFHIDVMDGKFVEKNTAEAMKEFSLTLSHITNIGLDVHLMVDNIEEFIDEYIEFEPEYITFHIEASKTKERTMEIIKTIKENGIKVGISINPATPVEEIIDYLPYVHMVLIMTVVPGKGGQKFILDTVEKIKELRKYINENNLDVCIEVDGGINGETASIAKEAGADILVCGTYLISSENRAETIKELKK